MKNFLEMIETVKKKKTIKFIDDGKVVNYSSEMFFHFAEHCVPFVFSQKNDEPVMMPDEGPGDSSLDAPFKVFSIEVFGSNITIPQPSDTEKITIKCIMVVEQKPKDFLIFSFFEMNGSLDVIISLKTANIVKIMLKRLNIEATGIESVRERVRVGAGKNKKTITIRRIVHVKPKKLVLESTVTSRKIDWSHIFSVRGHWRKMSGLGKDRDGDYCIENMTWIAEYEKGPEDSPLINKTRLVKQ